MQDRGDPSSTRRSTVPLPAYAPFFLERTADRRSHNDVLAEATGGRVGLEGVLAELTRTGRSTRRAPLLRRAATAFAWDLRDDLSRRWWPQGITTSADAGAGTGTGTGTGTEEYAGRRVVLTSSYSKVVSGVSHGARISVVDVTDPDRVRYEHVLLVKAVADDRGVRLEPLHAHAGGLVWHGDHLHVTATRKGFHTCRLSDIVAVDGLDQPATLGPLSGGGLGAHGHRWVLPLHLGHPARTDEGGAPFRYTYLSSTLDDDGRVSLLTGEYTHPSSRGSTRLAELAVDPATRLPALDADGRARPTLLGDGPVQAQGAVRVRGRLYVGTSNGRFRRGSFWVGAGPKVAPESFRRRPAALPAGPEDLALWPSRDELWTVTEYPGRRRVVALDRARLD
jgi:hypothetical protein